MPETLNAREYADRLGVDEVSLRRAVLYRIAREEGRTPPAYLRARPGIARLAERVAPPSGRAGGSYVWALAAVERFEREHGARPGRRAYQDEALAALPPDSLLGLAERSGLSERERRVLVGRYGLDGDPPETLAAIAGELGLSPEGVRLLQRAAEAKVKETLTGAGPGRPDR